MHAEPLEVQQLGRRSLLAAKNPAKSAWAPKTTRASETTFVQVPFVTKIAPLRDYCCPRCSPPSAVSSTETPARSADNVHPMRLRALLAAILPRVVCLCTNGIRDVLPQNWWSDLDSCVHVTYSAHSCPALHSVCCKRRFALILDVLVVLVMVTKDNYFEASSKPLSH